MSYEEKDLEFEKFEIPTLWPGRVKPQRFNPRYTIEYGKMWDNK